MRNYYKTFFKEIEGSRRITGDANAQKIHKIPGDDLPLLRLIIKEQERLNSTPAQNCRHLFNARQDRGENIDLPSGLGSVNDLFYFYLYVRH